MRELGSGRPQPSQKLQETLISGSKKKAYCGRPCKISGSEWRVCETSSGRCMNVVVVLKFKETNIFLFVLPNDEKSFECIFSFTSTFKAF